MQENELYYPIKSSKLNNILLIVWNLAIIIYLWGFTVDYKDINVSYIGFLVFLFVLQVFFFYIHVQTNSGKLNIRFEGNTFYMTALFGRVRQADMTKGYTAHETKKGVQYITINDESGKAKLLIGGNFKNHFTEIIELLESKK